LERPLLDLQVPMAHPLDVQSRHPREIQYSIPLPLADQARAARAAKRVVFKSQKHETPLQGACLQIDIAASTAYEFRDRQPVPVFAGGCA